MYCLDSNSEWNQIHYKDLWIYNKLILSRKLGYVCGPAGVTVPHSEFYIIRPCMNLMGMSRLSRIEYIEKSTEDYHPGEFWCEIFKGEHLSVDFYRKSCELVVRGYRDPENPLYKWKRWERIEKEVKYPKILKELVGNYEWINCEFIGDHLIEVHFRRNPDFRYGNDIAIPIWNQNECIERDGYKFVYDEDYLRHGFLIK